jgi:HAD superfamily hydrolase (TIGR01509 family)
MLKGKKLIIFDLDGTLLDTVGLWNEIDREIISTFGTKPAPDLKTIQTERDRIINNAQDPHPYIAYCEYLKAHYAATLDAQSLYDERYRIADDFLVNRVDYKPAAPEFLKALKARGLKLAVASTTRGKNIEIYRTKNRHLLEKAPFDEMFEVIYSRNDAERIKPDPAIHIRLMREFNVTPQECLIFEDSLVGAQAAHAAGIECAVIYDQYSDDDRDGLNRLADYRLNDFNQALKFI